MSIFANKLFELMDKIQVGKEDTKSTGFFIKIRFFLMVLIVQSSSLNALTQRVTIPDPNFVHVLQTSPYTAVCMLYDQLDTVCAGNVNNSNLWSNYWFSSGITDLTGMQYFKKITSLFIEGNELTWLPPLADGLTNLDCSKNKLASLPILPDPLYSLTCSNNQLSTLPDLPANLRTLACANNQLIYLPKLPDSLTYLNCSYNNLTTLPSLPDSIRTLYCFINQITSLPDLPDSLVYFYCSLNKLTSLPVIPPKVTWLWCTDNQLTFEDIVPLMHVTDFNYAPQDSVDNFISVSSNVGDSLQMTTSSIYTGNQYQWTKNDTIINNSPHFLGANTPSLVIKNLALADSGVYSCQITNPAAPLLTLYRRSIDLKIIPPKEPLPEITIYELISPNSDGDNDFFTILNLEKYKNIEVSISNIWGSVVFHEQYYQNDWNGGELGDGTYYYFVKVHDTNKAYKGRLLIKR